MTTSRIDVIGPAEVRRVADEPPSQRSNNFTRRSFPGVGHRFSSKGKLKCHVPAVPPNAGGATCAADISKRGYQVRVVRELGVAERAAWEAGFADLYQDYRYHEIIQSTLTDRFDHLYLVLGDDENRVRAVQSAFVVREDLLAGVPNGIVPVVRALRGILPNALNPKMLMVGCAAGEGQLAGATVDDRNWTARALAGVLPRVGKQVGAALVVMKEFSSHHRGVLERPMREAGFARVASMPGATKPLDFADFDEFMQKSLSRSRRADLCRKFRRAERAGGLELEVVTDISPWIEQAYPLYLAVYERAKLRFEKLTREYLCRLGKELPERVRFFIWRLKKGPRAGRMVAFSLCLVHGGVIHDCYIGLDYGVALDMHLYFVSLRDIMNWGLRNGCGAYWTAGLNYDPKLNLKMNLAPLDLYVRHTSGLANAGFRRIIGRFGPTRYDSHLRKFPNFGEL
jgi:hypothetical protein